MQQKQAQVHLHSCSRRILYLLNQICIQLSIAMYIVLDKSSVQFAILVVEVEKEREMSLYQGSSLSVIKVIRGCTPVIPPQTDIFSLFFWIKMEVTIEIIPVQVYIRNNLDSYVIHKIMKCIILFFFIIVFSGEYGFFASFLRQHHISF